MESASPTASASTNRGGRPKEWNETRTRRLVRLYVYTNLPFPKILELLEEDEFKPGKDAANKVKNSVLGNDPRWIRPKDDAEEGTRIRGLRNSLRGRRRRSNSASENVHEPTAGPGTPFRAFEEDASLGGSTFAQSYPSSMEELHYADSSSFSPSDATNLNPPTVWPGDANSSHFIPSLIGRLNTSRQDSGLTTSTDISIASALREKLSFLSPGKAKRAVKVLKRYTFPKDLEPQRTSDATSGLFQGPEFYSPADRVNDRFTATRVLPGDFLDSELFARCQRCATESPAHAAGTCWCKVAEQVYPVQNMWAIIGTPHHISDPKLRHKDIFGNTIFHHLAAQDGIQELFQYLVCHALRMPELPVRDSNTAGQTFLHVLHNSWFQEGSRLDDLLDTLRAENFDLFATDVYGRSVFHILRMKRRGYTRFSGQGFDLSRINRRDAFGMRPMGARPSAGADCPAAYQIAHGTATTPPAGSARPVPRINTQTGMMENSEILSVHTALLKIVTDSVSVNYTNTPKEDPQGRNAFHCLAEVDLSLSPATPKPSSRGQFRDDPRYSPGYQKRKHNEHEEAEIPLTTADSPRLNYIRGLICAKIDVNQYDKRGNTPLMSFVVNSGDATKYEKSECELAIRALVRDAGANLELRNRNGQTALHLAAMHGKTVALRVLLELGANPHARNAQGLGILEVLDSLYVMTERDDKNNARFEACRAILTRTPGDAVQSPTLVDEWGQK